MGCGASKAKIAICTGAVSNPKDGAVGVLSMTVPADWEAGYLLKLHHDVHGLLVKFRTVINGRPSIRHFEVEVPDWVSPGERVKITLQGRSQPPVIERA